MPVVKKYLVVQAECETWDDAREIVKESTGLKRKVYVVNEDDIQEVRAPKVVFTKEESAS